ncbi:hypothetical protein ACJMK2_004549 [Sinanodonta woodiana]|uniref:Uncharacterized protein n=1 Tax=Sinanodonta woodiana TaxID=1069815 RepID=A0ABD3Y3H0_SINWO
MSKSSRSSGYRSYTARSCFPDSVPYYNNRENAETQHSELCIHVSINRQGYTELNLNNQGLAVFPNQIFSLTRLEVLKISGNELNEIPLAITRLRSLRQLHLEENFLTFLPETLCNCRHLQELNLTRNRLRSLPTNILMLTNLRVLRLGQNHFECLPHEMGFLENLRVLDLHGNRLWYMTFSIAKLQKLKQINLANNRFEHVPIPVCRLTALKCMNLRGNCLTSLIQDIEHVKNLQELNLSNNRFKDFPPEICKLRNLMYLNLSGNKLKELPPTITSLKNLKVLHAQGNCIEFLPDSFQNLQYLNISKNNLYNFSVANMTRLKYVNANGNYLENIPLGTSSLARIEHIHLNRNRIQDVSPDIAMLKKLRTFDLGNNLLTRVPTVLKKLPKLDFFNIKGNKINENISFVRRPDIPPKRFHQQKEHRQKLPNDTKLRQKRWRSQRNYQSRFYLPEKVSLNDEGYKMWDSAKSDLLENGLSQSHLYSSSNSSSLSKNGTMETQDMSLVRTMINSSHISAHEAAILSEEDDDDVFSSDLPLKITDYKLLGICNQVEMLLNKQLLQPVLSLKGHDTGKSFSMMSIVKTPSGLWRLSDDHENDVPGITTSTSESFTITHKGGKMTSSVDPNVTVVIPPGALSKTVHARMKIVNVEDSKLQQICHDNKIIRNIISLGPIILLKMEQETNLTQQAVITIPVPTSDKKGHLYLLTIMEDNSCIPSSSGYRLNSNYIEIHTWNITG